MNKTTSMNSIKAFCIILMLMLVAPSAYSQEKKQEVRKEFRMEENDGVKTLFITTSENGVTTEEVFKGEEADAKLKEIMDQQPVIQKEIKKEVEVREHGDKKTVIIRTTENGKTTEEVFQGRDAEKKMKELGVVVNTEQKRIVEEPVSTKKKKKKRRKSN